MAARSPARRRSCSTCTCRAWAASRWPARCASAPTTADLPVVVLTALELDAADRARLQGKIQALVRKGPLAPARLVTAIRSLAERRPGGGALA